MDSFEKKIALWAIGGIAGACIIIPLAKGDIDLAGPIMAFVIVGIALAIYFAPAIAGRHKKNFGAILFLNFALGWTLIGWIVAMTWALTKEMPDLTS